MSAAEIDCYFSCKAAFVGALIDCDVRQIEEHFDDLMASKRSMATMKAHFQRIAASDCFDTHANWAPITDTAACKPNVIAALSRMEASIINQIRVILAFVRSLPGPDATGSVATQARATCLIAHDALFAVKVDDGQNAALTALIMCAIDWVLNDTLASLTGVPT